MKLTFRGSKLPNYVTGVMCGIQRPNSKIALSSATSSSDAIIALPYAASQPYAAVVLRHLHLPTVNHPKRSASLVVCVIMLCKRNAKSDSKRSEASSLKAQIPLISAVPDLWFVNKPMGGALRKL